MLNIYNAISLRDLLLCSNNGRMHTHTHTHTHIYIYIYIRVLYNEKNKRRRKLKKWDGRCRARTFFFLFFRFVLVELSAFALSFFLPYAYYISRVMMNCFPRPIELECYHIYIYRSQKERKKKKEVFLSSIQFNFHKCKQVSIFFMLPVGWLVVKYSFFFLLFLLIYFFLLVGIVLFL